VNLAFVSWSIIPSLPKLIGSDPEE